MSVLAFNPIAVEPDLPGEPIYITEDPYVEKHLLGDLASSPDLYQISSESAFTLTAQLRQRAVDDATSFGLIIIRMNENNAGVTEILRQNIEPELWEVNRYPSVAMSFLEAPVVTTELEPGTYRVEVSTPDNRGAYMLVIGDESVFSGPFSRFVDVFIIQHHFGVFPLLAFMSPYVFIPILALFATGLWFKRRWDRVHV